jgi:hypothetical protein
MIELKYGSKENIQLHCNNKLAIEIAHNPVQHDIIKYIKIDKNFIKHNLKGKKASHFHL